MPARRRPQDEPHGRNSHHACVLYEGGNASQRAVRVSHGGPECTVLSLSQKADIFGFTMFWSPSFDGMADLTPYFNHVIASYTGIQTVPHVQVKWGRLLRQALLRTFRWEIAL